MRLSYPVHAVGFGVKSYQIATLPTPIGDRLNRRSSNETLPVLWGPFLLGMAVFVGQTDSHIIFFLFMPQRDERINPARLPSRTETGQQGDAREEYRQWAKGQRVSGLDVEKHRLQEPG
jgi:hypothetical protein